MTQLRWGETTDTGQVRANNQDGAYAGEPLFAVADGMGGHRGGEVASAVALETLVASLDGATTDALIQSVQLANAAVYDRSRNDPELRGMGTTLCAVALVTTERGERLALVNVGDSRIYLYRGGHLEQITEDHSLVESLLRQGRITPEEAETHPQRNILTRALGISANVEVDAWEIDVVSGDRFLLCSDGLFNEVEPDVIAEVLDRLENPTETTTELVRLANEGGGRDNITAVVLDVIDGVPGAVAAEPERLARASEPDLGGMAPPATTAEHPVVPATGLPDDLPPAPGVAAAADSTAAAPTPTHPSPAGPPPPPPPPEPPAEAGDEPAVAAAGAAEPAGRSRRLTWRVLLFVLALLVLVGGVSWLLVSYARDSYFVAFQGDEVVIQQGRPGGFLFWDPTVVEETGIQRDDLQDVAVDQVEAEPTRSSLGSAEDFVAGLQLQDEGQDQADQDGADQDSTGQDSTGQDSADQDSTDAGQDEEEDAPASTGSTRPPAGGAGGSGTSTGGTGDKQP